MPHNFDPEALCHLIEEIVVSLMESNSHCVAGLISSIVKAVLGNSVEEKAAASAHSEQTSTAVVPIDNAAATGFEKHSAKLICNCSTGALTDRVLKTSQMTGPVLTTNQMSGQVQRALPRLGASPGPETMKIPAATVTSKDAAASTGSSGRLMALTLP